MVKLFRQKRKIVHVAGFLTVMMFLSRILGYVRDIVLLSSFGQSYQTDAYYIAFNIPDFIYSILLGGALGSAFIPIFTSYLANDKEEDSWIVASTVFNTILMAASILVLIGLLFTPQLIAFLAPGYDATTQELAVFLTRIMFLQCIFLCMSGISQGILQSYKQFAAPAIGSVLYNACIIIFGLMFKEQFGVAAFTIGVVLGALVCFLVQIPTLLQIGLRYRLILNYRHEGVRKFYRLLLPVMLGLSVIHLNTFVGTILGSYFEEGVVTALANAQRLMMFPVGIFAISIAIAGFPTMTEHAARGEMKAYKEELSYGFRNIMFVNLPASVGMAVLSVPIVRLMYLQGRFTIDDMYMTALALVFYCIGLIGYAAQHILNRGFYALQDTKFPVLINVMVIGLNIVLSIILSRTIGYCGLPLAYSVAGLASLVLLLYFLRRKVGSIGGKKMFLSFVKSLFASAIMGVCVYFCADYLGNILDITSKFAQLLQVLSAIAVGVGVYGLMAYLLRMEEMKAIVKIFMRKFLRRR